MFRKKTMPSSPVQKKEMGVRLIETNAREGTPKKEENREAKKRKTLAAGRGTS